MVKKSRFDTVTHFLKTLADDWLIIPEMPSYTGPRSELGKVLAADRERRRRYREKYQRIRYLKYKKWILVKKTEKGLMITLSELGKIKLLERTVKRLPKIQKGKLLILSFDFPEPARNGRDAFRYFIKKLGFTQLQLSVWKSDLDCLTELKQFIKEAGISRWVKIFVAENVS